MEWIMTNCEGNPKSHPPELTPRDDVKKVVSDVLRRVDTFIHRGELDQAELYVIQAREIDPKNIYAYAFQERISILKEQAHQNSLAAAACKAPEESKRNEGAHFRVNALQPQEERSKPQPIQQQIPQLISQNQPSVAAKSFVRLEPDLKTISSSHKVPVAPKDSSPIPSVPVVTLQASDQQQAEARQNFEKDQNLKVQRIIKTAMEAVRKEVEQKQMEIRSREKEEFARREQVRIKEATEATRKAEEQRQTELRRKSDEELQKKIREALRRKPASDIPAMPVKVIPIAPTEPLRSDCKISALTPTESPVSAERSETLERYKLVLSSVWADGAVSEEEASTLKQLRQSLSISAEEHARLEKQVQRDTYVDAFKRSWNSGRITPENESVLFELRERFEISNEEYLAIESRILWEIQPVKNRPTLLVIDDDERLLKAVSKTLNDAGFITTPVTTSDEAYAYLKESSPDLILCDVNLETSTMGGFAFYEKVREFDRLRETPFIFLSGLTDEALVRTGKELGVDDYLSKPVSEETLVATIKGKLRRYHELKKRMN
jgi:CheY-like chemotaxis protein